MTPTIGHLFDHRAVVWRPTETLGPHKETVRTYDLAYAPLGCTGTRKRAMIAQAGPGRVDAGERAYYFEPGPVFRKKDLIELISGPDAPALLEVESATMPRGHHIEVRVSEYQGAAPELGS